VRGKFEASLAVSFRLDHLEYEDRCTLTRQERCFWRVTDAVQEGAAKVELEHDASDVVLHVHNHLKASVRRGGHGETHAQWAFRRR